MELEPFHMMLLLIVHIQCGQTQELPKAAASISHEGQVFIGEKVILTCVIGENVSIWHYSWKKEGSISPVSSEQVYTISSVEASHAGKYTCEGIKANDSRSSSTSDAVTLTILVSPKAEVTVLSLTPAFTGESVALKCVVEGYNGWTYEWYKWNSVTKSWMSVIQSENYTVNGHNLNISEEAVENGDQYRCRGVRYHRPSTTQYSTSAFITTKALPRVTVSMDPQGDVFTGESVTLKCDVNAYSGWTYQWYKQNELNRWTTLLPSVNYTVNRDTISISRDAVVNGDRYRCRGERQDRPRASDYGFLTFTVQAVKPKPELTSSLQGAALMGNPVTLYCKLDRSAGWRFYWSNHTQNPENERNTATNSYTISSVAPSDGGQYWCRAGRGKPVYYTHYSDALWVRVIVRPKAEVMVMPDKQVFIGETVTLTCDIQGGGDTKWTYSWYKDGYEISSCTGSPQCKISSVTLFENGKYTCGGQRSDSQSSNTSDALTLTVSSKPQAVLSVFPQSWLTEGASVTLSCKVRNSSTGWTFSWYRDNQKLLSDSSRGAGGSYTVTSAAINHTGVYMCRAERGEPAYQTQYSNLQPLWITGVSPPSFLIISPNRTQHFSGDSLSLSCEGQSNSTEWRVRHYTQNGRVTDCSSGWRSVAGSTCTINYLYTFHTGVYWCQSESEVWSSPVNITVHDGDVILDSPVHVVSEGDLLTLRCLCQNAKPSNLSSSFYKDGLLILNQNTGEMAIHTVSKSDEGLYYCKYPGRGESPHSWILVRADEPSTLVGLTVGLCFALLFILLIIATWCYLTNKGGKTWPPPCGNQQNSRLTSVQEQMETGAVEGRQSPCTAFLSETAHIYDTAEEVEKSSRDSGAACSDVTYAEIELKVPKKTKKTQEITNVNTDTVYAELKDVCEGETTGLGRVCYSIN